MEAVDWKAVDFARRVAYMEVRARREAPPARDGLMADEVVQLTELVERSQGVRRQARWFFLFSALLALRRETRFVRQTSR